ncbi:MAG: hypothetical protein ACO1TE_01775 [Prosthecobacter sp.]
MKTTSILRALTAAALVLGALATPQAHAGWPEQWQITISPSYHHHGQPSITVRQPRQIRASGSDYQPELAQSYRQGWAAGQRARHCGWQRDSHGAFLCSGCAWESYFQEGYADGFDGHGMRH